MVATGGIGLVSQSGTIVVAMVRSARGFGFSHMVSSGNECVLDSADYLGHLVDDPSTRVLVSYLEGIRDPAKFLDVADRAFAARKPLIVGKSGRSDDGSAASAAHTGALAGSYKVQSAIFRQKGIVHCDDLDEMTEAMEMFSFARPPSGPGIGVIGISGGENALVMDQAAAIGLPVPKLSAEGRARLAALLPWFARPENPIDPTGAALGDAETYVACIEVLAAEPGIGVVVVSQDSPAAYDVAVAKYVVEAAKRTGKCIVYLNNFSGPWNPAILAMLREAGVPYLQGLREGLKAVKALIDYAARQEAGASAPPPDATPSPRRAEAIALLAGAEGLVTEDTAKRVLALYGLPVSPETLATTQDEALAAANAFGYPVVAKIVSPDVAHKAASGGVRLDLRSAADVASAWRDLATGFAKAQPQARIAGVLVQPMAKPRGAIEIILGVKRDAQFGPMVMFGLGRRLHRGAAAGRPAAGAARRARCARHDRGGGGVRAVVRQAPRSGRGRRPPRYAAADAALARGVGSRGRGRRHRRESGDPRSGRRHRRHRRRDDDSVTTFDRRVIRGATQRPTPEAT